VNTITIRKQNHLASTLLTLQQSLLPAHQRPQFQSDVMDDSQETRLPESQADQLYFEDGVGNDDAHGDNSDDDGVINDSVLETQGETQFSSIGGTPREQWRHSSSSFDQNTRPPSQIEVQESHRTPILSMGQRRQSSSSLNGSSMSRQSATSDSNKNGSSNRLVTNTNSGQGDRPLGNITNTLHQSQHSSLIPEWDGCLPDVIIKRLKALDKEELQPLGIKEFYKSYGSWEKMTMDQRNKTVSFFRTLPEEMQGL
jgi:hypothetical protein